MFYLHKAVLVFQVLTIVRYYYSQLPAIQQELQDHKVLSSKLQQDCTDITQHVSSSRSEYAVGLRYFLSYKIIFVSKI